MAGAEPRATLLLIEHGETRLDRHGRTHGHLDPPLTAKGREQARRLGARLGRMAQPPTVLLHSPRKRAAQTAAIAAALSGIPARAEAALLPLDVGRMSGQDEKSVAERLRPYFAAPWREIPGGERVATWRARHQRLAAWLAKQAAAGERPALVTHSNVIGSLLARANGGARGRGTMADPPKSGTVIRVRYPIGRS